MSLEQSAKPSLESRQVVRFVYLGGAWLGLGMISKVRWYTINMGVESVYGNAAEVTSSLSAADLGVGKTCSRLRSDEEEMKEND